MATTILIILIVIILALIGRVIFNKFSVLSNIKIEELKAEKQAEMKIKLAEGRVKEQIDKVDKAFKNSVFSGVGKLIKKGYASVLALEKKYKSERSSKKIINMVGDEKTEAVIEKINLAREHFENEEYDLAEEKYIELITIDSKNIEAYLGLAEVYLAKGDFEHAKELYEYVLKIDKTSDKALAGLGDVALKSDDPEEAKEKYEKSISLNSNPEHYVDLATAYYKLSSPGKALTSIRRAHELEPKNPKYLDFLIDAAILNKNKILALDSFKKLEKINPENSKLIEFKKRIREM